MKRLLLILALALFALPVLADHIHFDPVDEKPFMDCWFNATKAPNCQTGNFTVNDTEMEANNYNASGSWCNNGAYYSFDGGVDSLAYDNVSSLYNLTNLSIVIGFTPANVSKTGGLVSLFNNNMTQGGWSVRIFNDSYPEFRFTNATNDSIIGLDEQNFTGLKNHTNYTLVITLDGTFLRAWINNLQIEKHNFPVTMVVNESSKLRIGYVNTTGTSRFVGQIHFVYIYNYTLTPQQVFNRTTVICGSQLYTLNTTRFGNWPITNNSLPNWTNLSGPDRLHDPYNYRTFSDHANNLDFHRGIDFGDQTLLPIYAVMNGTVAQVENTSASNATPGHERFGNWVMIEHGPDPDTGMPRHTTYFHLNMTPNVTHGQNVSAGELIGYVGKSGSGIRDEHLHMELIRDSNEDGYSNRTAIHTLRILNYTDQNATSMHIAANSTDYILVVRSNFSDMDMVAFKFVGAWQNRTVDYETKQGLNLSNADQTCVNDVCFRPENITFPFTNYSVNYSITRLVSGPLAGAVIRDLNGNVQVYDITSWPNPNITLTKSTALSVNASDFFNYTILVNVSGDVAFNVTVSESYPSSVRFHNASHTALGVNDTFLLGNLSIGEYRINITVQALNATNGTIANNSVNVTYYNLTGTFFTMNTSAAVTINSTIVETPAPAPAGSSGGGGGGGSSGTVPPKKACVPNWFCSDWTTCLEGTQARECIDLQGCGTLYLKPEDFRTCTSEVNETPSYLVAPFTPSIRPRQAFYISKFIIVMILLIAGVAVSHSHLLLKLRRDPVRAYVLHARAHGANDRMIKAQLKKAGWKDYAIEEGMKK